MSETMKEIIIQLGFNYIPIREDINDPYTGEVHIFTHPRKHLIEMRIFIQPGQQDRVVLYLDGEEYCSTLLSILTFATLSAWYGLC